MAEIKRLKVGVENILVLFFLSLVVIQVIGWILTPFIPQLATLKLGFAFILFVWISGIVFGLAVIRRGFGGIREGLKGFTRTEVLLVMIVFGLIVGVSYFFPIIVPEAFSVARVQLYMMMGLM